MVVLAHEDLGLLELLELGEGDIRVDRPKLVQVERDEEGGRATGELAQARGLVRNLPDGARVTILDAGRATLELANPAQKRFIDEVEVGRQVAPKFRVAFEVDDVAGDADRLVAAGAELIAAPVETPWRSRNARLAAPAGVQLTLFEELPPPR